jgi:cysteine protease ATG4
LYSFWDNNDKAPFGIYNIAREALKINRKPGDWYGPQAISIVLKDIVNKQEPVENFKICLFVDGFIYWDKLIKKANNWANGVYVIIPLRLGIEDINEEYLHQIKKVFTVSSNVGIIGGKEHHALYFVGLCDDNLLYLDPHYI